MLMKCKTHPNYQGICKPRVDCLECWKIYAEYIGKELDYMTILFEHYKSRSKEK